MAHRGIYLALLVALVALGVANVSEARELLADTPPYIQCGGLGGKCGSAGKTCQDKPWPQHKCASGFSCTKRVDKWYWQCAPKSTPSPTPKYVTGDFKQCGGSGNGCTGSKCKDAVWPGVTCRTGLKCYRISKYYYQCDTHQPKPSPGASPSPPVYSPSDFKQCGGKGGSCKGADCKDAQTGTCKAGLKCYRVSQWYRACDTHKPTSG